MVRPSNIKNLLCAGHSLDLRRPRVMGVLNITPDSFSDGGHYWQADVACRRAEAMMAEGADLVDVGGESTRPGAKIVSVQEELDRVIPVVEALVKDLSVPISVDTSKPEVMVEAIHAGAGMINDVYALQAPDTLEVLSEHANIAVCLMHMQGKPTTMQRDPRYTHAVDDIKTFLEDRICACEEVGIGRHRLLIDPGFGFGKTLEQNLQLLHHLGEFHTLGVPLLVGLSRKSMLGAILDVPVGERLYGSLAAAVIAAFQGAHIIRAHDVEATVQALKVCSAVMESG